MIRTRPNSSMLIVSIYSSPAGNFDIFLQSPDKCLDYLFRLSPTIVLGGDFNMFLESESHISNALNYFLKTHGMFIGNREPTRGVHSLDTVATSLNLWDYTVDV